MNIYKYAIAAVLIFATVTANAASSNKWRLQVSGNAESDGLVTIFVNPDDAPLIRAEITINQGTSENRVAKRIVRWLRKQLPSDHFRIERDDGEDVLIKKRLFKSNFVVRVHSNTVKGLRITRDRE
jgi:hypothetical protein